MNCQVDSLLLNSQLRSTEPNLSSRSFSNEKCYKPLAWWGSSMVDFIFTSASSKFPTISCLTTQPFILACVVGTGCLDVFIMQMVANFLLDLPQPHHPTHTQTHTSIPSGQSYFAPTASRIIISPVLSTEKDRIEKTNPQLRLWLLIILLKTIWVP